MHRAGCHEEWRTAVSGLLHSTLIITNLTPGVVPSCIKQQCRHASIVGSPSLPTELDAMEPMITAASTALLPDCRIDHGRRRGNAVP
jgi:hypothetical protein